MKLIQAMKQVKDLLRKAEDIRGKIATHCAYNSIETPTYGDKQRETVAGWLQSHDDILKEVLRLRRAIQWTNLETAVTIELDGKQVTKSIAEWIHRRRDLAKLSQEAWGKLGDKNLREGTMMNSLGEKVEVKIVRAYDPATRDRMLELYRSEPSVIDATLEVVNAITDLVEG